MRHMFKNRLLQKSEGNFSEQSPGSILRGIFWLFSGLFPLKKQEEKIHPKIHGKIQIRILGHTPSTAGTFRKKFRKDPGDALRAFPGIPVKSAAGIPQALYLKAFEASRAFPASSPPSTAGSASFFRSGSGEGLSELVMEFPAVLRVSLNYARSLTERVEMSEKTLPEMNRKGLSRFSTMRALSIPRLCQH